VAADRALEHFGQVDLARHNGGVSQSSRDEVLIGGKEVWAVRLERLFPALFRRLIRRVRVT
jgi:hypothetical protein